MNYFLISLILCLFFNIAQAKSDSCIANLTSQTGSQLPSLADLNELSVRARKLKRSHGVQDPAVVEATKDYVVAMAERLSMEGFQVKPHFNGEDLNCAWTLKLISAPESTPDSVINSLNQRLSACILIDPLLSSRGQMQDDRISLSHRGWGSKINGRRWIFEHEIRHVLKWNQLRSGIASAYQGYLMADDGERISSANGYTQFLSFDEMLTYHNDIELLVTAISNQPKSSKQNVKLLRNDSLRLIKMSEDIESNAKILLKTLETVSAEELLSSYLGPDIMEFPKHSAYYMGSEALMAGKETGIQVYEFPVASANLTPADQIKMLITRLQKLIGLCKMHRKYGEKNYALAERLADN